MKKILEMNNSKYIIFGIILCLVPTLQQIGVLESATVIVLGTVMFYSIVAIGLNVLLGYSGLISLGTAGFMGLGAYLSAYFTEDLELPFILSVLLSAIIPLAIGLIIGLISLRIEGYYLAIATLGVSEVLKQVFIELEVLTGGFSGKNASYPIILGWKMDRQWTFILIAVVLVLILILTENFIHARTGRAMLTMRGSESAAKAMGINILQYKLTAFAVSTLYASIAGVLYVHFIRFSYPSGWNLTLSLQILAVIVIGGMRTISGPILGALIVFGIPELVLKQLPIIGNIDGLAFIFTGVLIIIVILFYPNGLIYIGNDVKKWAHNRRHKDGQVMNND